MTQYNPKDIFIQRRTSNNKFEEHPLVVHPNSVIITDSNNDLMMVPSASLSIDSASFAYTASYLIGYVAPTLVTASISSSWASSSLSSAISTTASYANSASYSPNPFDQNLNTTDNVLFNSINVGTANSQRGIVDINNTASFSVPDVTTATLITFFDNAGMYGGSSQGFQYDIYAYKNTPEGRVYSVTPMEIVGEDTGHTNFYLNFAWGAVAGADGYRVIAMQDFYFDSNADYYFDTTGSSATIGVNGIGYVEEINSYYQSGNTVTPKELIYYVDIYVDSTTGILTSTKNIVAPNFIGTASLSTTASYVRNAISASYTDTSSFLINNQNFIDKYTAIAFAVVL